MSKSLINKPVLKIRQNAAHLVVDTFLNFFAFIIQVALENLLSHCKIAKYCDFRKRSKHYLLQMVLTHEILSVFLLDFSNILTLDFFMFLKNFVKFG